MPVEPDAHREGKANHEQEPSFEDQPTWRHAELTLTFSGSLGKIVAWHLLVPLHRGGITRRSIRDFLLCDRPTGPDPFLARHTAVSARGAGVSEEPPRLFSESASPLSSAFCNTSCSSSTQHSNNPLANRVVMGACFWPILVPVTSIPGCKANCAAPRCLSPHTR